MTKLAINKKKRKSKMTDEEYLKSRTNKEICAEILRGIIRFVPVKLFYNEKKYLKELKKKLKFNHEDDCDLAIAAIDLIEDTENAIIEFIENGLGKENESHRVEIGEAYLRLYGVLNAIYLQINGIREIATIFNLQNKNERIADLTSHKIFELRNKIGSHTISYLINKTKKANKENLDFFRLAQVSLSKKGSNLLVVSHKTKSEEINLSELIYSYNKKAELILFDVCEKSIYSIFPNKYENRDWLEFQLEFVNKRIKK